MRTRWRKNRLSASSWSRIRGNMFSIADSNVPSCGAIAVGDSSVGGQSARVLVWCQTRCSISAGSVAASVSSASAGNSACAETSCPERQVRDSPLSRFAKDMTTRSPHCGHSNQQAS